MSTLTADTLLPPAPGPGVTAPRVAKAEWIKFRSLRSTWYSLGAAMVAAIGLGRPVLGPARQRRRQPRRPKGFGDRRTGRW